MMMVNDDDEYDHNTCDDVGHDDRDEPRDGYGDDWELDDEESYE
jgi:hypothetical protein